MGYYELHINGSKVGGKGKQDIRDWLKTPGVRVAALCDVDRAHLDPEVQKLGDQNINVEAYTDVRKLLENGYQRVETPRK